jgi:hypothetical protein
MTDDADRATYRASLGIPERAASCHTGVVDGYAIEGHIPARAIQRLLRERPAAVGLALPGMPEDSPGMGGDEATWSSQPVSLVHPDGSLAAFTY